MRGCLPWSPSWCLVSSPCPSWQPGNAGGPSAPWVVAGALEGGDPPKGPRPSSPCLLPHCSWRGEGPPGSWPWGGEGWGWLGTAFPHRRSWKNRLCMAGWEGGGERALSTEHSLHSVWGWGLRTAHSLHPSGMVPGTGCQALRLRSWVPRCLSPPPAPAAAAPDLSWHVPAQPASPAPPAHSLCRGSRRGAELGWHRPGASSLDARAGLGATMVYRGWQPPAQGLVIAPHPPPSRRHLRIPGLLTA